jgi:hypothetical protein
MKEILIPFSFWFYILELKVHSVEHIETVELTSHILSRYVHLQAFNSLSYSFTSGFCAFFCLCAHTYKRLYYWYSERLSRFKLILTALVHMLYDDISVLFFSFLLKKIKMIESQFKHKFKALWMPFSAIYKAATFI